MYFNFFKHLEIKWNVHNAWIQKIIVYCLNDVFETVGSLQFEIITMLVFSNYTNYSKTHTRVYSLLNIVFTSVYIILYTIFAIICSYMSMAHRSSGNV